MTDGISFIYARASAAGQAPQKSGHYFKTLCIMYDTRRTTMPTLNIYLDPNSKETLDRLSGPGQRSATIREMLNKYRNNTIGAPDVTRVKVNISLSDEDKGSLDNLAKAWGVSASEAINRMIKAEKDQLDKELTAGNWNKL
jgi:hypothetical protein